MTQPLVKHPQTWAIEEGLYITKPRGWDRDGADFEALCTYDEYRERMFASQVVGYSADYGILE